MLTILDEKLYKRPRLRTREFRISTNPTGTMDFPGKKSLPYLSLFQILNQIGSVEFALRVTNIHKSKQTFAFIPLTQNFICI